MKKRMLAFLLALLTVLGTFPLALLGVSATEAEGEAEKLVWDGKYAPLYVQDGLTFFWLGEENKIGTTAAVTGTITNAKNPEESVTMRTYNREWAKYFANADVAIGTSMRMIDKGVVYSNDGKMLLTEFIPTRQLSDGREALADMTLEVSQAYPEYYKTYANQKTGTLNTRGSDGTSIFLGPLTIGYTKQIGGSVCFGGVGTSYRYVPVTYTDPETQESRVVYIKTSTASGKSFDCYEYDPETGVMTVIEELQGKFVFPSSSDDATAMKAYFSNPTLSRWGVSNSYAAYKPFDVDGYGPLTGWINIANGTICPTSFYNFDGYGKPSFMNAPTDTAFTTSMIFNYEYDEEDLTTDTYGYTLSLGRDGAILDSSEYAGSYDAKKDYTTYSAGTRDDGTNYAFSYGLSITATYYYSLRIYNKVLSADEQAQNYFIDLAYRLDADMTDYINLNAKGKKIVHNLMVGKNEKTANADDIDAAIKTAQEKQDLVEWDGKYAPLYVQDGLTFFWTGEGLTASSSAMTSIPNMLSGKTDAITKTSYDRQTPGADGNDKNGGRNLSVSAVAGAIYKNNEYKFNMSHLAPVRAWDDSATPVSVLSDMTLELSQWYATGIKAGWNGASMDLTALGSISYAKNHANSLKVNVAVTETEKTALFDARGYAYTEKYTADQLAADPSLTQVRTYTVTSSSLPAFNDIYGNPIAGPVETTSGFVNAALLNTEKEMQAFTTSFVFDYDEKATAYTSIDLSAVALRDGVQTAFKKMVYDATADYAPTDDAKYGENERDWYLFGGVAIASYYQGIRLYNRVLSAEEMAKNHFVDLALRFGADLTVYVNLKADEQAYVHTFMNGMYEKDFADKAAFEQAIEDALEAKKKAEVEAEEIERLDALYADLYVTDVDGDKVSDLVFRWDAYRLNEKTTPMLSLQNKAGEGAIDVAGMQIYDRYATFIGVPDLTEFLPKEANGNHADLTLETVAHQIKTKGTGTVAFGSITPYAVSMLSAESDTHGWIGSTYKNNMSPTVVSQTYYFDASGNKVEASVEGGSSVTVNYLNESNELATDSSWSNVQWLARPFDQVFTYGASLDYNVNENGFGSMELQYLHDGKMTASKSIAYLRGYSSDATVRATVKRIVPANLAEAEQMAAKEAYQNMNWTAYNEQLAIGCTNYAYYAIRLYDKVLSEAQRNQNHFADLASYFGIDRELIDSVIACGQFENVCTALASVQFSDTDKEGVTKVLRNAYYANYLSDYPVLKFEGYQVKNFENKGVRSLYTVDLNKATDQNATLVEIGAIMAIATNRVTSDLILEKANVSGSQMMSQAVWTKDGGFLAGKTFEDEGGLHFAYTIVYADDAQALALGDVELLFRGYAVIEIDGVRYVSYADMTTSAFNDTHKVTLNRAYEKADSAKRVYAQSIQVGATESERRFVWTSERNTEAYVRYALKSAYDADGGFTDANTTVVQGTVTDMYGEATRKSCKVRVEGLELGKEYVYSVGGDYGFEEKFYTFKTQDNLDEHQSFNIISDVHMSHKTGATSTYLQNRTNNFQKALAQMLAYTNDLSFIVSTGDNVSQYAMSLANPYDTYHIIGHNEQELFFSPDLLKTIPFASTMGNHEANVRSSVIPDASVSGYYYDMPNSDGDSGRYQDYSSGNFYFRNGNVLIIGVNVRATQDGNSANTSGVVARAFVKAACEANTDAKWKILVNHIPAYAYIGNRASDKEMGMMEQIICSICDEFEIDIMFSGHQHAFSRSYPIKGHNVLKDEVSTTVSGKYSTTMAENPTGTVYYNVPAVLSGTFYSVEPTYKDYLVSWGLAYSDDLYDQVPGFDGITYTAPMYVNCQTDGDTLTVRLMQSSNNAVLDTYVLTKTAE